MTGRDVYSLAGIANPEGFYYHAGVEEPGGEDVLWWSPHTRRTYEAAAREARKMARRLGGRPFVEYWRRSRGLRPGDADAVVGWEYVDSETGA